MRKILVTLLSLLLIFTLTSCEKESDELILRVYSWQDYIDDGTDDSEMKVSNSVMEDFEDWYYETYNQKVTVVYDTFETPESMLNTLKTGKTTYDLCCPSEYILQKMIKMEMLEEFDYDLKDENGNLILENTKYFSPYLSDIMDNQDWTKYAVIYMWGTSGIIYNSELVDDEDATTWDFFWNTSYKDMISAKDSVRDVYLMGAMKVYFDELMELKATYENGDITAAEYKATIQTIMNRCDSDTLDKIEEALKEMKENLYGFEVESGKSDICTGKIAANCQWSGDAEYSIEVAEEENDVILKYTVPEEGSNIWFDCWVMPKGANVSLAESFVNFLCDPDIALRNMEFIGYTSPIIGNNVLDMVNENYGALPYYSEDEQSWMFNGICLNINDQILTPSIDGNNVYLGDTNVMDILETIINPDTGESYAEDYADMELFERDLTFYFDEETIQEVDPVYIKDGKVLMYIFEELRCFDTRYPTEDILNRCGIMIDFGDDYDNVLEMWESVKIGNINPIFSIVVGGAVVALCLSYVLTKIKFKKREKR